MQVLTRPVTPQTRAMTLIYEGDTLDQLKLLGKGESYWVDVQAGANLKVAVVVPEDRDDEVLCDFVVSPFGDPRQAQTIDCPVFPDAVVGGDPVLLSGTASSGLPVSFRVLGPGVIEGNKLYATSPGRIVVSCEQGGNDFYQGALSVTRILNALPLTSKAPQSITFPPVDGVDGTFNLAATATSGLPVQFEVVSGTGVITSNILVITGDAPVSVKAYQPGNDVFEPASPVYRTLLKERLAQTIELAVTPETISSLAALSKEAVLSHQDQTQSPKTYLVSARASSGLPVALAVISGTGSFEGSRLTVSGSEAVVLRAFQDGDAYFAPAFQEYKVKGTSPVPQQIDFPPVGDRTFGEPPLDLVAQASSGLPVSFNVLSGPAEMVNGQLILHGAGPVTIQAIQGGDGQFAPATVEQTFMVARAPQNIQFDAIPSGIFHDAPISLAAVSASGLPIEFEVIQGPGMIEGAQLRASGAGEIVVRASQPGNENYLAAEPVTRSVQIAKTNQKISFDDLPDMPFSSNRVSLNAIADTGLEMTYEVTSGNAIVAGNSLQIFGTGVVTVRAKQSGNENFEPAFAEKSFHVSRAPQTITFVPPADLRYGSSPTQLQAQSSSGLPIQFEALSGPISIDGQMLRVHGAGMGSIKAVQPGDENYLPADSVSILKIEKAEQSIEFVIPSTVTPETETPLTASSTSGLTVHFNVISGVGSINGTVFNSFLLGSATIEATQEGNENFQPAPSVRRSILVVNAPELNAHIQNGQFVLKWNQAEWKLEVADSPLGAWREYFPAPNLQEVSLTPDGDAQFFRLKSK